MVLIQVMIGGITRLTESGLSIVEWNVVMGSVPPASADAWEAEFEKYRQTAQYEKVNTDFTVSDFKKIYWWEFIHRLWARLIGFVFLLPFIWFLVRRKFSALWTRRLLVVFILGGLQGFVGWIMVASGLEGDPWVDPGKLTIHLLLALAVFMYLIWLALLWKGEVVPEDHPALRAENRWIIGLILLQIALGGLMAGTDAGSIYTTWPLMQGNWMPDHAFAEMGAAGSLVDLAPEINFVHRTFALIVAAAIIIYWWTNRKFTALRLQRYLLVLVMLVLLQCILGILTLIHGDRGIPVFTGVAHQVTACIMLGLAVVVQFYARRRNN